MYGFSDPDKLITNRTLREINQIKIFEDLFQQGEIVFDEKKYFSIFRKDSEPGCYFELYEDIVCFIDRAEGNHDKIQRNCLNAVAELHKCSLEQAYALICNKGYDKVGTEMLAKLNTSLGKKKSERVSFSFTEVPFSKEDVLFWSQYLITPEQLKEDGIFSRSKLQWYKNGKKRTIRTDFHRSFCIYNGDNRQKFYFPFFRNFRFISNTNADSIGNFGAVNWALDYLIITKSYKDCRVLRNILGAQNVIWFHSEGSIPLLEILSDIATFDKILIVYDNDRQGFESSDVLQTSLINVGAQKVVRHKWSKHNDAGHFVNKEGRLGLEKEFKNYGKFT